jgi:hypothetical protein
VSQCISVSQKLIDSARCPACGSEIENVTHFTCPGYAYKRWVLKGEGNKLSKGLSLESLLGNPDLTISLANFKFIDATHRFKPASTRREV